LEFLIFNIKYSETMEYRTMGRPKKTVPNYRFHLSGQAVVTFNGTNFYLGKHNSPESQAKYSRLVAEYIESGYLTPNVETHQGLAAITVADVCSDYREHINKRYANAPKEILRLNRLCELLEMEHGDCVADAFGPRRLDQVRDTLIASGNSRRYVNRLIRAVRQIVRHALSPELIDPLALVKLESLEPLRHGQLSTGDYACRKVRLGYRTGFRTSFVILPVRLCEKPLGLRRHRRYLGIHERMTEHYTQQSEAKAIEAVQAAPKPLDTARSSHGRRKAIYRLV
jgi:hypothetical protein